MRLWHYKLLPYLPEHQFRGQLRELVAILHTWRDKGQTNHILINRVMEYPKADFYGYFLEYAFRYQQRYNDNLPKHSEEFRKFGNNEWTNEPYQGWHDKEYLRICMANLYEKHLGRGKSRITDAEWERLMQGYKKITGEEYRI